MSVILDSFQDGQGYKCTKLNIFKLSEGNKSISVLVYMLGNFLKEILKTVLEEKIDIFSAIKLKYLDSSEYEKTRST